MKITSRLLASLTICVAATALAATLTTQSPQAAAKATIQTDLADYPPDTQVNVTGSGFLAGEVVELTFTETATTPPGGFTDGPFVFFATSDGQGNIANGGFSTDQHDVGVHFLLTAKGAISGKTARTTFTDDLPGLFAEARRAGDVRLYACSSSMAICDVRPEDLLDGVEVRGLTAFLLEDMALADEVLTF